MYGTVMQRVMHVSGKIYVKYVFFYNVCQTRPVSVHFMEYLHAIEKHEIIEKICRVFYSSRPKVKLTQ